MLVSLFLLSAVNACIEVDYAKQQDWGGLCSSGQLQSPVDLSLGEQISHFIFPSYPIQTTPQIEDCDASYSISISNSKLFVKDPFGNSLPCSASSISFHSPSEHQLNSQQFDLELQIYHTILIESNYTQVVLSLLFHTSTQDSPFFNQFIANGQLFDNTATLNLSYLLNNTLSFSSYYLYEGSLTVPPCTEGVLWFIIADSYTLSDQQLSAFQSKWSSNPSFAEGAGNNRELQASAPIIYHRK